MIQCQCISIVALNFQISLSKKSLGSWGDQLPIRNYKKGICKKTIQKNTKSKLSLWELEEKRVESNKIDRDCNS